ncbi:MAG: endo-1,4-beta-xylanase [Planctomycetota bacterium]
MRTRSKHAAGFCLLTATLVGAVIAHAERPRFRADAVLKDYAGETLMAVGVHGHGSNGVLTGPNAEMLRGTVTKHADCAQAIVFAAWPHAGGIWPAEQPSSVDSMRFDTTTLDWLIDWAVSEDLTVAHHLLIGPNFYMPTWFATAGYTPKELDDLMRRYLAAALGPNGKEGRVRSWNLVNEVFETDNSGHYRNDGEGEWDSRWVGMGMEPDRSGLTGDAKVNAEHPVFIRKMFEYANELTDAKLEIRDYKIEFARASVTGEDGKLEVEPNRKALAFYQLVKHLQNSGVPIDAVGFQMHLNYGSDHHYRAYAFEEFTESVRKFKRLGLEVYIAELDVGLHWDECDDIDGVRVPNDKANFVKLAEQQPKTYYEAVRAARLGGVDMISTWGIVDGTMENWRKDQKALLIDEQGQRKPAYQAVLRALYDTMPE